MLRSCFFFFFFFNDTATTEIYTLSLHDALPIYHRRAVQQIVIGVVHRDFDGDRPCAIAVSCRERVQVADRSEEHTSELQSRLHLVCRLLLEKKKNIQTTCSRALTDTSIAPVLPA